MKYTAKDKTGRRRSRGGHRIMRLAALWLIRRACSRAHWGARSVTNSPNRFAAPIVKICAKRQRKGMVGELAARTVPVVKKS